MLHSINHIPC